MTKRDAAKVKAGDTLYSPHFNKRGKVEQVIPEPTEEHPKGNFPLFKVDFDESPITYKLFDYAGRL